MRRTRILLQSGIFLILITGVSGCSVEPESADLWGEFEGEHGAVLELSSDGTFDMSGIPLGVTDGATSGSAHSVPSNLEESLREVTGEWQYLKMEHENSSIMLFPQGGPEGTPGNMQIIVAGQDSIFFVPDGDRSDRYELHRAD